jgi:hypothetical protein
VLGLLIEVVPAVADVLVAPSPAPSELLAHLLSTGVCSDGSDSSADFVTRAPQALMSSAAA